MTLSKEELSGLIERVRGLKGADRDVDGEIHNAMFGTKYVRSTGSVTGFMTSRTDNGNPMVSPYTGSIDASIALVEQVQPGWGVETTTPAGGGKASCRIYPGSSLAANASRTAFGSASTTQNAILLALLLSLQSQEPTP